MTDTVTVSSSALEEVNGIGPALSKQLAEAYSTWGDIAGADLRVLTRIKGMSIQRAAALQSFAQERADRLSKPKEKLDDGAGDEYIFVRKQIDKFNSRRVKIKLHPGVCRVCGFDILKHNDAPVWDLLPDSEQVKVRGAMKKHMEYHATRGVSASVNYL